MTRFCTRRTLCLAIVLAAGVTAGGMLSPASTGKPQGWSLASQLEK